MFFIYLYQRWIYRVDPNRVNEFGTSGVDQMQDNKAVADAAPAAAVANTDKPEGEKKNDWAESLSASLGALSAEGEKTCEIKAGRKVVV